VHFYFCVMSLTFQFRLLNGDRFTAIKLAVSACLIKVAVSAWINWAVISLIDERNMKRWLEPINTRRRLGGSDRVDMHFISHAFAVLTASCCASSTFDLGVRRAWRKRDLRNHYRNIPARGGNQVFGQRHTRPLGGSATTSSTRSSTHCARTVGNFLICGLFICAVWLYRF
jgi:hypothetical protein